MAANEVVNKDLKILVVDDHPMTRNMVRAILKGVGYTHVWIAESAMQAQEALLDNGVDLVVCDWNMPGMSGFEFLGLVRKQFPKMPFIMLTAEAYKENVEAAIKAGVTDYIIKPFTAEALIQKVSSAVNQAK